MSLVNRIPKADLEKPAAALLDIRGAYGAFLYLIRREYPALKLGIVDFPEQLLLTRYFLKTEFPTLRINSLREAFDTEKIDEEFIERFDVVFVPVGCYEKICAGVFSVV